MQGTFEIKQFLYKNAVVAKIGVQKYKLCLKKKKTQFPRVVHNENDCRKKIHVLVGRWTMQLFKNLTLRFEGDRSICSVYSML